MVINAMIRNIGTNVPAFASDGTGLNRCLGVPEKTVPNAFVKHNMANPPISTKPNKEKTSNDKKERFAL